MSAPRVRVTCPATTANLGPGFDALGLALGLHNVFTAELGPEGSAPRQSAIVVSGPEGGGLAGEPDVASNRFVRGFGAARAALGFPPRAVRVDVEVHVPPGRGLGSSATATVAGLLAGAALAGKALDPARVAAMATAIEGHPDNALPCLLGGLCVAVPPPAPPSGRPEDAPPVAHLRVALETPPVLVVSIPTALLKSTEVMRRLLPAELPFRSAVDQVGRVALLVAALLQGRHDLLPTALVDHLHEPHRGPRIPGFEPARAAALEAGALGAVLSGSGPTLLAFCADAAVAARVGAATEAAWKTAGVPAVSRVLPVDLAGARLDTLPG